MTIHVKSFATRPALLSARGIVKVHGSGALANKVLKGVDVDLFPGELTLMMGPSGSGKTTLLSILGCLMTPTRGSLSVAGQPTDGLGPEQLARLRRARIGFVFQSYNLFPTLTALDNVLLALDVRRAAGADPVRMAKEALTEVGLGHRMHAYPAKLSGGEKQRVAIARALAGNPSLILADEPTAALDKENGKAVMELLARIAKDPRRAVLAVTHDHRTLGWADRIIHIEDGRIDRDERPSSPRSQDEGAQPRIVLDEAKPLPRCNDFIVPASVPDMREPDWNNIRIDCHA